MANTKADREFFSISLVSSVPCLELEAAKPQTRVWLSRKPLSERGEILVSASLDRSLTHSVFPIPAESSHGSHTAQEAEQGRR
jgi:hypothetical protein